MYHNENYPSTLPYDSATGEGYIDRYWPQGLTGPESPAAVCRIGIMKSTDGGWSWDNKGLFLEDKQPRMILKPFNTSNTFAGGVGDPSAVASGEYLYLFYGEYGYPGVYDSATYSPERMERPVHQRSRVSKSLTWTTRRVKRSVGMAAALPYHGDGTRHAC
ncbi:MAG: hypothetical protein U5K79_15330 [Cyclobacteriaceae bacterium]|nr:hypothetical protein [Cyclobacteriaceae bacterium]